MENKFVWIALSSLIFLGCTKTITIGNPVTYYEEIPTYEIRPSSEIEAKPFNITPLEVFDKMQDNLNILLLDVRMAYEIPQDGKIANSIMIPLQVLAQNLNRLDKAKRIIVYCHVGNRSVEATKLLRSYGFDAVNMSGGIEAWKRDHLSVRWK
jgi:rhodanese-related sulfurtransferase